MNDNEVKLVDELVAVGLTRDWLVDAIETPDIPTIKRAVGEFKAKVNDPFWEISLLDALFERIEQYPAEKSFPIVELFLTYGSYNDNFYLDWLATTDYELAFPIFNRLIAANDPLASRASAIIASNTIQTIYNGDLEAAMQDASRMVVATAAWRIIGGLESARDHMGMWRAFAFPFSDLREHVAWHMGRHHVHDAVEPLIAALRVETDVEAMRAMLWSLGVLRNPVAADAVEVFVEHEHPLIATTAREALAKLQKVRQ